MERLTSSQIADFLNPLAFARSREARVGQTKIRTESTASRIRTSDIEASYRLMVGAAEKLEILEGNLNTMLELARSARFNTRESGKVDEIYGKLRSLSAGFDQVVNAIQFDQKTVFTGDKAYLNLGDGVRTLEFDTSNLRTYGEDSLDLSSSRPTAKATIGYRTEDRIVNETYDIIGLDIDRAEFIDGANPALELQDGTYKVAISYAGAESNVEIRTMEGALIEKKSGVDLSGSGREWVDFEAGVRIVFDKESLFSSFDKYPYETKGPAELVATLNYERVHAHVLRTGESEGEEAINLVYQPSLEIGGTSMRVGEPEFAPTAVGKEALESGLYNLEVEYHGEQSILRLTDMFGRLKAFDFNADLSQEGTTEIDFGLGFTLPFENHQFNTDGGNLVVPIKIQKEKPAMEDFDFQDYADKLEAAILIVQEQRSRVDEISKEIEQVNQQRNSANTAGVPSTMAFNSNSAISLLSGGGDNSLFKPRSASSRLNVLSTQLFSTTTALPAQANQSPRELASLQNTAAGNSWLGNFA